MIKELLSIPILFFIAYIVSIIVIRPNNAKVNMFKFTFDLKKDELEEKNHENEEEN